LPAGTAWRNSGYSAAPYILTPGPRSRGSRASIEPGQLVVAEGTPDGGTDGAGIDRIRVGEQRDVDLQLGDRLVDGGEQADVLGTSPGAARPHHQNQIPVALVRKSCPDGRRRDAGSRGGSRGADRENRWNHAGGTGEEQPCRWPTKR